MGWSGRMTRRPPTPRLRDGRLLMTDWPGYSEIAFLARSTEASEAGPPGFSVASAWLSPTNSRRRRS
jgi:hypothetical protein